MQISKFDRANIKEIRASLEAVVAVVAKEYGITIDIGSIRGTSDSLNVKMVMSTAAGETFRQNYDNNYNARIPDGTPFKFNGTRYRVVGFKPNGRKFQYVGEGPQGGRWKFTAEMVRKGMGQ